MGTRVRVTFEFDVQNVIKNKTDKLTLRQNIYDDFGKYMELCHLRDASMWLADSKSDKKSSKYLIYEHHKECAEILGKAKRTITLRRLPVKK